MPSVDHVGIVAGELKPIVDAFKALGFRVSRPVPLCGMRDGESVNLGQHSAHIVLANFYIEIAAPDPGRSDNHLVPYLERFGPGTRIVAFACNNAPAAHAALSEQGLELGELLEASRTVAQGGGATASFRWFPVVGTTELSALTCWVEQLTPELVFHPASRTAAWTAHSAIEVIASCDELLVSQEQFRSWAKAAGVDRQAPRLIPHRRAGSDGGDSKPTIVDRLLLASSDLERYRGYLEARRMPYTEEKDGLWVSVPGLPALQLGFIEVEEQ